MGGVLNTANNAIHSATGIDVTGGYAAQQGMQAQQDAASQANSTQLQMYNQTRQDQQPWREAGQGALNQIQAGNFNQPFTMAQFQQDPGYQFALSEGQKAIERSASARGGVASGATMKSLDSYTQGLANQDYQNAFNNYQTDTSNRYNRLSSLAGLGETANNQSSAANQNYANQYASNVTGAANAQAAYGQQQQQTTNSMIGMGAGLYAGSKGWL